jgi:hypothetical protein
MHANRNNYLASVSAELRAQATRIRDLIGDKHWLSDGHHKEYLLKSTLARHIPTGVAISRGFVVDPRRPDLISREQDLLFVDTMALQPVFHQGGLCVVFPQQVLAAIAVKTRLSGPELEDACATLHSVRRVSAYAGVRIAPWSGILFFEPHSMSDDRLCEWMGKALSTFEAKAEKLAPLHSCPNAICVSDVAGFLVDPSDASGGPPTIRGFGGDGVVLLLHSLLTHLAFARGSNSAELEQFFSTFELSPLRSSPLRLSLEHSEPANGG